MYEILEAEEPSIELESSTLESTEQQVESPIGKEETSHATEATEESSAPTACLSSIEQGNEGKEASEVQSEQVLDVVTYSTAEVTEPVTTAQAQVAEDDFLGDLLMKADQRGAQESSEKVIEESLVDSKNGSSSESDTESGDISEDDDDDDSDDDDAEEDNGAEVDDEKDASDNEGESGPIRSKNEVSDEPAKQLPENFRIEDSEPIHHIGEVTAFVEKSIIIKSVMSGEFRFLKEGSVICFEDRTPLGYLFEIFGPVAQPFYRVKLNSDEDMEKFKDTKKQKVFYVVPKSDFEYTDTIKAMKGTDASNWNDEEIPEEEQEFSDDEKEMESKKSKKQSKKNKKRENPDGEATERAQQKKKPQTNPTQTHQQLRRNPYNDVSRNQSVAGYQSRSQREQSKTSQGYRPGFQQPPQPFPPSFHPPPPPPSMAMAGLPGMPGIPGMPPAPGMAMGMPPFPMAPGFPQMQLAPPVPGQQQPPQRQLNPMQMQQIYQMQQMMMHQFMQNNQQNQQHPPQGGPHN